MPSKTVMLLRTGILCALACSAVYAQTFAADDFVTGHAETRIRPVAPVREEVASARAEAAATAAQCNTTGPQNIAVLTVSMPSNPTLPAAWTNSAIQQAYFAASGLSLNTFWQEASYGKTSATGQVFGPFPLGADYDCSNLDGMASAAVAAASSTVDFTKYSRIGIVFPVRSCVLPGFGSLGGYGSIGCYNLAPIPQNIAVAWFPILPTWATPANSVGVFAHEHGHNLGLNHGNTEDFSALSLGPPDTTGTNAEYGDPFSVMGQADVNSTLPTFGQYSAEHKSLLLNWLQQPDFTEVLGGGSYTLSPYESSSGTRALRILRDPVAGSWLWAEYRQPLGVVDSTLSNLSGAKASNAFQGVLLHYENPNLDLLHTYLLDMHPTASPNSFYDAALTPGQSFSDPNSLLTLRANSSGASGFSLTVTRDTACATPSLSGTTLTITAPPGCSWTASTASSWITLNGAASGSGNAIIPLTLAANTTASQRLGFVTVARQTVPVIQAGTVISVTGVSPAVLNTSSGQITIQAADPAGASDVVAVYVTFSGAPSCSVTIYPPTATFALTNDAGTALLGPTNAGTLSNSSCSVLAGASSVAAGQGTGVTVNLAVSFPVAFAGSHHMTIGAQTKGGQLASLTFGTWTVPATLTLPTPALTAILPAQAAAGSAALTLTVSGTNFVAGETANWNGTALATTFVSSTQLTATVPATLLAASGTATVSVSGASGSQSFTIAAPLPAITPSGVVPVGSTVPAITPGSWFSIYGANFAAATYTWDGSYPTTLGGVSVRINGKPAYLSYVGPTQINALAPADTTTGAVAVTVTNAAGTATSSVTLATLAPALIPLDSRYAIAVLPAPDGSYTLASAANKLRPGQVIELFGVGFGPTTPAVLPPQSFTGSPVTANKVTVLLGGVPATVNFAGMILNGLYQINVVIPQLPAGDALLKVTVGTATTPDGSYLPIGP